jgi:hypothetical protein
MLTFFPGSPFFLALLSLWASESGPAPETSLNSEKPISEGPTLIIYFMQYLKKECQLNPIFHLSKECSILKNGAVNPSVRKRTF